MHLSESWKIFLQTIPYLFFRILVYVGMGIGIGCYLGFVFFLSRLFGTGAWFFLLGLVILWGILRWIRKYLLYMVQAGQIAVVTEWIQRGALPPGIHQVRHGKDTVLRMFKETSLLFVMDQSVKGVIRSVNRSLVKISRILPLPGLEHLVRLAGIVLQFAVTYVDEALFSYILSRPEENIWDSAKRGIILYVQNWQTILRTALVLAVINGLSFLAFFLLLLIPLGPPAFLSTGEGWKFFWLALTVILAFGLKQAVVNPFSMISIIVTFHRTVAAQEPDPTWEIKLEALSDKFRQLKEKARA